MSGVNRVILVGRITQPEQFAAGASMLTKFTVCTSERWKDHQGEWQERTEFHRCVSFGKTGQYIFEKMPKGTLVSLEGKLQTRSFEKDGVKREQTSIHVEHIQKYGLEKGATKAAAEPDYGAELGF